MPSSEPDDQYPPEEVARRRDEVVKRMLNTPPQPHRSKSSPDEPGKPTARRRNGDTVPDKRKR